jgi:hypothetical protein
MKIVTTAAGVGASLAIFFCAFSLAAEAPLVPVNSRADGGHDFDFEIGTWKTHLSRLIHPLSGSAIWTDYDGTTVVRKVWNGRANLVELEVQGPSGHIEALSLRVYNPGKSIKVRFVIANITRNSCRFEQAYSEDGGKTWEINWIATDTRLKDRRAT